MAAATTWQQLKQESDQDWLLRKSDGDHARAGLLYQLWDNTPSSLHQMHLTQLLDAGKDLGAPKVPSSGNRLLTGAVKSAMGLCYKVVSVLFFSTTP